VFRAAKAVHCRKKKKKGGMERGRAKTKGGSRHSSSEKNCIGERRGGPRKKGPWCGRKGSKGGGASQKGAKKDKIDHPEGREKKERKKIFPAWQQKGKGVSGRGGETPHRGREGSSSLAPTCETKKQKKKKRKKRGALFSPFFWEREEKPGAEKGEKRLFLWEEEEKKFQFSMIKKKDG